MTLRRKTGKSDFVATQKFQGILEDLDTAVESILDLASGGSVVDVLKLHESNRYVRVRCLHLKAERKKVIGQWATDKQELRRLRLLVDGTSGVEGLREISTHVDADLGDTPRACTNKDTFTQTDGDFEGLLIPVQASNVVAMDQEALLSRLVRVEGTVEKVCGTMGILSLYALYKKKKDRSPRPLGTEGSGLSRGKTPD